MFDSFVEEDVLKEAMREPPIGGSGITDIFNDNDDAAPNNGGEVVPDRNDNNPLLSQKIMTLKEAIEIAKTYLEAYASILEIYCEHVDAYNKKRPIKEQVSYKISEVERDIMAALIAPEIMKMSNQNGGEFPVSGWLPFLFMLGTVSYKQYSLAVENANLYKEYIRMLRKQERQQQQQDAVKK